MAKNKQNLKNKNTQKKIKLDLYQSMIEREYWEDVSLKDPVTGIVKTHRVKIVRYKHKYASLDDIEEQDPLLEKLSTPKNPSIDIYEE